jgi:predicted dehydrogenase
MAETLGFGIVGAGLVAPFHAKSIKGSTGGRLVAICDLNRERADKLAAEYGAKAYYDLDVMLKDPAIQVVNVITPNHLHYDAVLKCAAAGKHVLTEKPPAMSLRETDEMVAACRQAKVRFGCTVQCRVRASIQAMRKALASGRYGKLLAADTSMKWFRATEYYQMDAWRSSRRSGAGVTVQHAFHYIDLLQYLAGPIAKVEARMTNLSHPAVKLEDTLVAHLTYANGAHGLVHASTAFWPGTDVRIELNGTDGTTIMSGEKMVTWQFRTEQPEDAGLRQLGNASQKTAASGAADFGHADHQVVIQDMIDSIHANREVVIPVSSVRPTVELVLAMYQSAAYGKPITLPIQDDPAIWEM